WIRHRPSNAGPARGWLLHCRAHAARVFCNSRPHFPALRYTDLCAHARAPLGPVHLPTGSGRNQAPPVLHALRRDRHRATLADADVLRNCADRATTAVSRAADSWDLLAGRIVSFIAPHGSAGRGPILT